MTDQQLRQLEAAWRASGSVEDETAWIRARVQAGELSEARLRLVASLGNQAATHALAENSGFAGLLSLVKNVTGLEEGVRFSVAAARHVLPIWQRKRPLDLRPQIALDAAEVWLAAPSEEAGRAADAASDLANEASEETERESGGHSEAALAASLAASVAGGACGDRVDALESAVEALNLESESPEVARVEAIANAVRDELVPWALGYGDPVRMRVAKRGEVVIRPENLTDHG